MTRGSVKNTVEASQDHRISVFPWQCTLVRWWHNLAICTRLRKWCNSPFPPSWPLSFSISLCLAFSLSDPFRRQIIVDVIKSSQPVDRSDRYIKSRDGWDGEFVCVCLCVVITLPTLSPTHPHWRGRSLSVLGLLHWIRTDRGDESMKRCRDDGGGGGGVSLEQKRSEDAVWVGQEEEEEEEW